VSEPEDVAPSSSSGGSRRDHVLGSTSAPAATPEAGDSASGPRTLGRRFQPGVAHPNHARRLWDRRTRQGARLASLAGPAPSLQRRAVAEAVCLAEWAVEAAHGSLAEALAARPRSPAAVARRRNAALAASVRLARLHEALAALPEAAPRDPLAALRDAVRAANPPADPDRGELES